MFSILQPLVGNGIVEETYLQLSCTWSLQAVLIRELETATSAADLATLFKTLFTPITVLLSDSISSASFG